MNFISKQKFLIKKSIDFIKGQKNNESNIFSYLVPHSPIMGHAILKFWLKGFYNRLFFFKIFFKHIIFFLFYDFKYSFRNEEHNQKKKFKYFVLTWSNYNSFSKSGLYKDKYFNYTSKNKNIFWFIIYMDDKKPKKIDKNICLFFFKKKFSLNSFFKKIFYVFNRNKFSKHFNFGFKIYEKLEKTLNFKGKIFMPYEGQPFQNTVIKKINENFPKIKTIGYIHSFPIALPTNLIFRDGAPEILIVNGVEQVYCLKKYLGWKNEKIRLLPSSRFYEYKENSTYFKNQIYLPYEIKSKNNLINNLNNLFSNSKIKISPNFNVKNHPEKKKSRIHLQTIELLKKTLTKTKKKNDFSIIIGATGSAIELLSRGIKVIHLSENPEFEIYSKSLWPSITVKKIEENSFIYKAKKRKNLILLSKNSNQFDEYLKV